MSGLKFLSAIAVSALTVAAFSASAEATFDRPYGYDRYGYNAPNFPRWYDDHRYSAYVVYPEFYVPPPRFERDYGPDYACYYDNGYDLRPHRICYRIR